MVKKRAGIPAIGVSALVAGGVAGHQLIARWRKNPDPLRGGKLDFPDGQRRIVELSDGARINTVTVGEGPIIVCVHGLTSNEDDWSPMAPLLLDAGFQLVAINQRGHGGSTEGTAGFGSTQLGEDLSEIFESLDLHAHALMGHSMGGMASMAYAVHHPEQFRERVSSLVLIATAASLRTPRQHLGLLIGGVTLPDELHLANDRLRVGTGLLAFGARPSLHMIDLAIAQFQRCSESVRSRATGALQGHDVRLLLHKISVPALVIGGTRDQLIRPQQVEALAEDISNSTLEMLDRAGHMLIWERHEDVSRSIVDWLRQSVEMARLSSDDHPDQDPT
jgi:non-heme chloroperoxidase